MYTSLLFLLFSSLLLLINEAWQVESLKLSIFKRYFATLVAANSLGIGGLGGPQPALAIDVSQVKNLNDEVTRLKSVQDAMDARDVPYNDLPSGVSYRQFREGKGDKVVERGSTIVVEMTLRAKKLATQKDPGGVLYYSTAKDSSSGTYSWTIGDGTAIPGVEEALLADGGARRSSIRRIDIPSVQIFKARKLGQLPEQKNEDEIRLTRNLWKTVADMIVEVRVVKIIPAVSPANADMVTLGEITTPSF